MGGRAARLIPPRLIPPRRAITPAPRWSPVAFPRRIGPPCPTQNLTNPPLAKPTWVSLSIDPRVGWVARRGRLPLLRGAADSPPPRRGRLPLWRCRPLCQPPRPTMALTDPPAALACPPDHPGLRLALPNRLVPKRPSRPSAAPLAYPPDPLRPPDRHSDPLRPPQVLPPCHVSAGPPAPP
jgi:hypothetical protein